MQIDTDKWMEKNMMHKKTTVAILTSDKIVFKREYYQRQKGKDIS